MERLIESTCYLCGKEVFYSAQKGKNYDLGVRDYVEHKCKTKKVLGGSDEMPRL